MRDYPYLIALCYLLLFSSTSLLAMELCEKWSQAQPGDYWVIEQGKMRTFLWVNRATSSELTLEEWTLPKELASPYSWKNWWLQGASGHTAHLRYNLQLPTGNLIEAYSITKQSWLNTDELDRWFTTLLHLTFELVPLSEQKRVGGVDSHILWAPPLYFNGKRITSPSYSIWKARWPKDESDWSGKIMEIYLPTSTEYPNYFPYWVEVRKGAIQGRLRVIDSGRNLFPTQP